MPHKPKRPCGHSGCANLSDGYYCERHRFEHHRDYNTFRRDPATNKKYGGAWRKIRARFIAANPLCEGCKKLGRFVPATEVHHVKPLSEGGGHEWNNLMSLCHSCHSAITMSATNAKRV
jgi:5-methylcytosine-specific restriction protein A